MPEPTDSELQVLKLFWREGPMSSREVQEQAAPTFGWADSTTRTVLERMRSKGLLARRSVHGVAVYEPAQAKVDIIGGVLKKLRSILEIDGSLPAAAFTGSQILTEAELAELSALLENQTEEARD